MLLFYCFAWHAMVCFCWYMRRCSCAYETITQLLAHGNQMKTREDGTAQYAHHERGTTSIGWLYNTFIRRVARSCRYRLHTDRERIANVVARQWRQRYAKFVTVLRIPTIDLRLESRARLCACVCVPCSTNTNAQTSDSVHNFSHRKYCF